MTEAPLEPLSKKTEEKEEKKEKKKEEKKKEKKEKTKEKKEKKKEKKSWWDTRMACTKEKTDSSFWGVFTGTED